MDIRPRETVGLALWHLGVQDLALCEAAWRLADSGETCVDAGANIGVVSGVFALRSGKTGRVFSFEPHPDIYRRLKHNTELWTQSGRDVAAVQAVNKGLSDHVGSARLAEPDSFEGNEGTSRVVTDSSAAPKGREFQIELATLDDTIPSGGAVGVMKLDVEGHEESVLRGAAGLIGRRAIRDILYEEHTLYPSPTSRLLEAAGYRVFFLDRTFGGPALLPPAAHAHRTEWEAPNFLATLDPARAESRLAAKGWQVL